jgi:phage portal protein BeeE
MNFNIFQRKKSTVFTEYSALQLMMEPSWSKRDYVSFAEEGYIKNVIAFRAINMIASAAASVPFTLCQLTDQGKSQLKIHPLLKLLYSPNPITSKSEFIERVVTYRLVSGNAYNANSGLRKEESIGNGRLFGFHGIGNESRKRE